MSMSDLEESVCNEMHREGLAQFSIPRGVWQRGMDKSSLIQTGGPGRGGQPKPSKEQIKAEQRARAEERQRKQQQQSPFREGFAAEQARIAQQQQQQQRQSLERAASALLDARAGKRTLTARQQEFAETAEKKLFSDATSAAQAGRSLTPMQQRIVNAREAASDAAEAAAAQQARNAAPDFSGPLEIQRSGASRQTDKTMPEFLRYPDQSGSTYSDQTQQQAPYSFAVSNPFQQAASPFEQQRPTISYAQYVSRQTPTGPTGPTVTRGTPAAIKSDCTVKLAISNLIQHTKVNPSTCDIALAKIKIEETRLTRLGCKGPFPALEQAKQQVSAIRNASCNEFGCGFSVIQRPVTPQDVEEAVVADVNQPPRIISTGDERNLPPHIISTGDEGNLPPHIISTGEETYEIPGLPRAEIVKLPSETENLPPVIVSTGQETYEIPSRPAPQKKPPKLGIQLPSFGDLSKMAKGVLEKAEKAVESGVKSIDEAKQEVANKLSKVREELIRELIKETNNGFRENGVGLRLNKLSPENEELLYYAFMKHGESAAKETGKRIVSDELINMEMEKPKAHADPQTGLIDPNARVMMLNDESHAKFGSYAPVDAIAGYVEGTKAVRQKMPKFMDLLGVTDAALVPDDITITGNEGTLSPEQEAAVHDMSNMAERLAFGSKVAPFAAGIAAERMPSEIEAMLDKQVRDAGKSALGKIKEYLTGKPSTSDIKAAIANEAANTIKDQIDIDAIRQTAQYIRQEKSEFSDTEDPVAGKHVLEEGRKLRDYVKSIPTKVEKDFVDAVEKVALEPQGYKDTFGDSYWAVASLNETKKDFVNQSKKIQQEINQLTAQAEEPSYSPDGDRWGHEEILDKIDAKKAQLRKLEKKTSERIVDLAGTLAKGRAKKLGLPDAQRLALQQRIANNASGSLSLQIKPQVGSKVALGLRR